MDGDRRADHPEIDHKDRQVGHLILLFEGTVSRCILVRQAFATELNRPVDPSKTCVVASGRPLFSFGDHFGFGFFVGFFDNGDVVRTLSPNERPIFNGAPRGNSV